MVFCGVFPTAGDDMDTLASIHPQPATWLRDSDLDAYAPAYRQRLVDQGYAVQTVRVYLCSIAHFARWAGRCRRAAHDLAPADIAHFVDEHLPRCDCPPPVQRHRPSIRAALRHLLTVLRDADVLIEHHCADAVDEELRRFDEHMHSARGLAANTRAQRLRILRLLLAETAGSIRTQLPLLEPEDLRRFIARQLQRWSPASAGVLASTLRSYLRFRAVCGDPVGCLLATIATPANWRLAPLPQTLTPTEVAQLLQAFSPAIPSARRAYAMVRCVVDLGLRASEVVSLTLDDLDWNAGTLRISRNKSRREGLLPLPQQTGTAIAEYLRHERPRCVSRVVFVRHVAPVEAPIGPGVVRRAVREAYRRCGLPNTRVHVLRHTLAERLLDGGGTLKEVADVLRHRSLDTSLIYAKVDTTRLAAVAMPWPGSAA
jgi:site-specific recombinase XerD